MDNESTRNDIQKALLYDLRLLFSRGEQEHYSKEEIVTLIDDLALPVT